MIKSASSLNENVSVIRLDCIPSNNDVFEDEEFIIRMEEALEHDLSPYCNIFHP